MKKIRLASSWDDITIAMFYAIEEANNRLMNSYSSAKEHGTDPVYDEADHLIDILDIISDADREELLTMPVGSLMKMAKAIEFMNEKPYGKIKSEYQLSGITFKAPQIVSEITTAQYIDMTEAIKKSGSELKLHETLSFFMWPKDEEYDGSKREKYSKIIADYMNVADAEALCLFFSVTLAAYEKVIKSYSEKKKKPAVN